MQRLTLSIPGTGTSPGDLVSVFANVDQAGRAMALVNTERPICEPRPIWSGLLPVTEWLNDRRFVDYWLGMPAMAAPTIQVLTPQLYFGLYQFVVVNTDPAGNQTTAAAYPAFVNSGSRSVRNFRQTGVSSGRPVFSFVCPDQLRRAS